MGEAGLVPQARALPVLGWREAAQVLLLGAVLLVGAHLRFTGLNWDEDQHLHPDERFLTMVETGIEPAAGLGEYFDTSASPLNPHNRDFGFFVYGTLPIFIVRYAAEWAGQTGYGEVHLLGRALSAGADLLVVLLVYLIGARLYRRSVGILAAAFSALAVLQIQQSHFFTVDTFATLFVAAGFYFAVLAMQSGRLLHYGMFGLLLGMAVASRINTAPLAMMIALAAAVRLAPAYRARAGAPEAWRQAWWEAGKGLALAAFISLLAFRVFQPYAFQGPSILGVRPNEKWLQNMREVGGMVSGRVDFPPNHQWTDRPAVLFPLTNMVLWGMGLPMGLTVWGGFAWAAWRMVKGRDWQSLLLPVAWTGAYFGWQSIQWVKPMRYQMPVYPTLAVLGAWAVVEFWRVGKEWKDRRELKQLGKLDVGSLISSSAVAWGTAAIAGTALWAFAFLSIYTRPVTRVSASRWIFENVPGPFSLHLESLEGDHTEPISLPNGTVIEPGGNVTVSFTPRATGALSSVTVGHVRPVALNSAEYQLQIHVTTDSRTESVITFADAAGTASNSAGSAFETVDWEAAAHLEAGQTYYLRIDSLGEVPVTITGANIVEETTWDDGLPLRVDGRDGFGGIYEGQNLELYWDDNAEKVERIQQALDAGDLIAISSNRQYGSITRLPMRYPLTVAFYRALFGCPEPESVEACGARLTPETHSGDLGYELVAAFQSNPRLGSVEINDQLAEEPFTVYDHPKVMLFGKSPDYSPENLRRVLAAVDLDSVVFMTPLEATRSDAANRASRDLMLPASRLRAQRSGGTWSELFNEGSLLNQVPALGAMGWWLFVVGLGWAAYPLARIGLGGLRDKGFPLAKVVALLAVAWPAWILGSFQIPFSRWTLWACVGALVTVSGVLAYADREALSRELRKNRRYFLAVEGLAFLFFLAFLLVRWGNSDLWHPNFGGEKPMDFSYLNAVLKSTSFPPYDPWFAGGYINYYYYGFVLVAIPIKLLALVPSFAYNLVLPTLFSMLAMGAFSVAYNLVSHGRLHGQNGPNGLEPTEALRTSPTIQTTQTNRTSPWLAGVAAALAIVVLGNLGQVKLLWDGFIRVSAMQDLGESAIGLDNGIRGLDGFFRVVTGQAELPYGPGSYYWDATRTIPPGEGEAGPITEFPFFTFLYADLHAHMFDLPVTALGLAWAVAVLLGARRATRWWGWPAALGLGGLVFGAMRPTNTWDFPAYLGLGVLAAAASAWVQSGKLDGRTLVTGGIRAAALVALAVILYQPYSVWYGQGYTSAELWEGSKTPLSAYLRVHGLFLFILVSLMAVETRRWLTETPASALGRVREWLGPALFALGAVVITTLAFFVTGYPVALLVFPLAAWSALLALRPEQPTEKRVVFSLAGVALLLTMTVEVVVLTGDIARMNTVFKFYLQVWSLFAVCAGAAFAWIWAERTSWLPALRRGWTILLVVLVGGAASYPLLATVGKVRDRIAQDSPRTLDGMAYMRYATYHTQDQALDLSQDYAAIRWMQQNVIGSPVIVEANIPEYRWGSRFTIYTGLPGVVGWNWHQRQQRAVVPPTVVTDRVQAIEQFYQTVSLEEAGAFLREYDVRYIVLGGLERAYYASEGLAKFEQMERNGALRLVFGQPGGTLVYEVLD